MGGSAFCVRDRAGILFLLTVAIADDNKKDIGDSSTPTFFLGRGHALNI